MDPLVLQTQRLRLRPLARDLSDLEPLNAIQADPDHMRYYPHPFSMQDSRAWIQRWLEHEDRYGYALLAVEDREGGEFLGNVGFIHQVVDGIDELELGWSITPARARQGIATEAAAACRDWAFGRLDVDHLISLVRPENEPSAGVARNLGMRVWKETVFGSLGWIHQVFRIDRPTR
ncbi:MAG: GNAT family N-acetyltransferase [Actinomycetota bacterium]